jgi:hypothetical protein
MRHRRGRLGPGEQHCAGIASQGAHLPPPAVRQLDTVAFPEPARSSRRLHYQHQAIPISPLDTCRILREKSTRRLTRTLGSRAQRSQTRPSAVLGVAPLRAERARGHGMAAIALVRGRFGFSRSRSPSGAGIRDRSARLARRGADGPAGWGYRQRRGTGQLGHRDGPGRG